MKRSETCATGTEKMESTGLRRIKSGHELVRKGALKIKRKIFDTDQEREEKEFQRRGSLEKLKWRDRLKGLCILLKNNIAPQVLMPRGIHAASFWLTA